MSIESLPISVDPSFEVTAPPNIEEQAAQATDYKKVGVILGAAFITWRVLIKDNMPALENPTAVTISEALKDLVSKYGPTWAKLTVPALEKAYQLGSHGALDEEEIGYLARVYSAEMGDYINQTSAQALLEGFNALVNQRWSPQIAYQRALEGVGLAPRQMQQYITAMDNLDAKYLPNSITDDPRVNSTLTKLLADRSLSIGENEAYTVQEMGRQLMWMRAAEQGLISPDVRRMWRVTKDERTCPMCLPMNEKTTGLTERFEVDGASYWTPAVHPNCRCWVELIEPEIDDSVAKAYDPQEHPRGGNPKNKGQFSRHWGQGVQVKESEPERDAVVDEIIASAMKASKMSGSAMGASAMSSAMGSAMAGSAVSGSAMTDSNFGALKSAVAGTTGSALGLSARQQSAVNAASAVEPSIRIQVYFKTLADNAFPWLETMRQPNEPKPPEPRTLYGFALEREFAKDDVIDFAKGRQEFVGDDRIPYEYANASWVSFCQAVANMLDDDDDFRRQWLDNHFSNALMRELHGLSSGELDDLAEKLNIAPEGFDDATIQRIHTVVMDGMEHGANTPPPDDRVIGVLWGDSKQGLAPDTTLQAAMHAAEEDQARQFLDGDPDLNDWEDGVSRYLEQTDRMPMGEDGEPMIGHLPVPTIYEIADPISMESARTLTNKFTGEKVDKYFLLDKYVVTNVTRDYHSADMTWDFPFVQKVTLVPVEQNRVEKFYDPFGVVHLAVKRAK